MSSFSFALQRPCKIKQLKDRFPPTVSFIFWQNGTFASGKNFVQLDFYIRTFCPSKVRCFMELCQIWLELHHRVDFLFDCTIPRWCFQICTSRNGYSFCPQGFYWRNSQFSGHEHFCQVQTQFSIFFFSFRKLNFENGSVKFQVSVFYFVIHVLTKYEQSSSRHVTLNY